ncbi:MAG: hypothetical protein AAGF77_09745 [Bacteroidota bacterium]
MVKGWSFIVVITLIIGCGKGKSEQATMATAEAALSFKNIPNALAFNSAVDSVMATWSEYQAMDESFAVLRRASNPEDAILALDDLIEKERAVANAAYPEAFDQIQVKSRQRVIRTFLLKIRNNLEDRRPIDSVMIQLADAHNALRNQFNIIMIDTLDIKKLLSEE